MQYKAKIHSDNGEAYLPLDSKVIDSLGWKNGDRIHLEQSGDKIILSKQNHPREGWEQTFKDAGANNEQPIDVINAFDNQEWSW